MLPNPPRERPRAWSSGSSGCWRRLFLKPRLLAEMHARMSHRCTINPNRSCPLGRDGFAGLEESDRRSCRFANFDSSRRRSARAQIAQADPAMGLLCGESIRCHLAFGVDREACGRLWPSVLAVRFGNIGSINSHCSSVSSCRFIIPISLSYTRSIGKIRSFQTQTSQKDYSLKTTTLFSIL